MAPWQPDMQIISFLAPGEPSQQPDLSLLAIRYVRALVNAQVPVYWQVLAAPGAAIAFTSTLAPRALTAEAVMRISEIDSALGDLRDLFQATREPVGGGVTLAMTAPQWWPALLAPLQGRRIAYLEPSPFLLAEQIAPYCSYPDEVWLPDEDLAQPLLRHQPGLLTKALPPVRRLAVQQDISVERLAAFRQMMGVGEKTFVFYAMLDAHSSECCADLLRAYSLAFDGETKADVALVVQCPPEFVDPLRDGAPMPAVQFVEGLLAGMPSSRGHDRPKIVLLDKNLNSTGRDLLHACGNALLVPRSGDALGLRAIDAAEVGNEVIGPAGRSLEFLLGTAWQALAGPHSSAGFVQALAPAMREVWLRRDGYGGDRDRVQWHVANALSEAAFVLRVQGLLGGAEA